MDTHYHIWLYRRAGDGTIRSMERDDVIYPTRRKANFKTRFTHHKYRTKRESNLCAAVWGTILLLTSPVWVPWLVLLVIKDDLRDRES